MSNQKHRAQRVAATSEDLALFEKIETQLYSAVVSDALDELGCPGQAMHHSVRPLWPDARLVGWARTIECVDADETPGNPYAVEIEAVDSILEGEVVVISTGGSTQNAPWANCFRRLRWHVVRAVRLLTDWFVMSRGFRAWGFPFTQPGSSPWIQKGGGSSSGTTYRLIARESRFFLAT